jgi:hypothetical protein
VRRFANLCAIFFKKRPKKTSSRSWLLFVFKFTYIKKSYLVRLHFGRFFDNRGRFFPKNVWSHWTQSAIKLDYVNLGTSMKLLSNTFVKFHSVFPTFNYLVLRPLSTAIHRLVCYCSMYIHRTF